MRKPPINFITLHYAWILSLGILGLIFIYPYGNLRAIDAYFFGVSASTESGLNTVDVKALKTYQQFVIYLTPVLGNLGFINILVVVVRLHWFNRRFKAIADSVYPSNRRELEANHDKDPEANLACEYSLSGATKNQELGISRRIPSKNPSSDLVAEEVSLEAKGLESRSKSTHGQNLVQDFSPRITFDSTHHPRHSNNALYIPSPREREQGQAVRELNEASQNFEDDDEITKAPNLPAGCNDFQRQRSTDRSIAESTAIERVTSSMFVVGAAPSQSRVKSRNPSLSRHDYMPEISSQATVGRNSHFRNLTREDREILGGLEYRALRLLLKIVVGYFFGLHLFGAIVLVGWIHTCNPKYREYLSSQGQNATWWGFYSAQTMVDNLGFTLTPDSMLTFQDAQWPMIFMSFLAFAGNTCYPCLLRLVIWVMYKLAPATSASKAPLNFLLQHPRRCYTLLFPSRPTWILFGILFMLNFVDILLIIFLDLHNPAVAHLAPGPRVAAAIFQAASARHTGTSSFNLADVHPAVQFSLLVMMYISVFPIAIAVRASNTYEEKSLGFFASEVDTDEARGSNYVLRHMQNQLSFDLWYIFLGIFCICVAEADKISDDADPAFAIFPIFFEVVSAYGNVGLSLGHPSNLTSLSGHLSTFSKLVICALMIRGRHRGLPYQLDRAIVLPSERNGDVDAEHDPTRSNSQDGTADIEGHVHTQ